MVDLIHDLVIERAQPVLSGGLPTFDSYNQPVREYVTLARVRGLVQPLSAAEVAAFHQAGADVSDHRIFILPTDIVAADRIRFYEDDGNRYEIVGRPENAGGVGHHIEINARLVAVRSETGAS